MQTARCSLSLFAVQLTPGCRTRPLLSAVCASALCLRVRRSVMEMEKPVSVEKEKEEVTSEEEAPAKTPVGMYMDFSNLETFAGVGIRAANFEIIQNFFIHSNIFDDSIIPNDIGKDTKSRKICHCKVGRFVGRIKNGGTVVFDASELEGQICKKNQICSNVSARSNPRPSEVG